MFDSGGQKLDRFVPRIHYLPKSKTVKLSCSNLLSRIIEPLAYIIIFTLFDSLKLVQAKPDPLLFLNFSFFRYRIPLQVKIRMKNSYWSKKANVYYST